MRTLRTLVPLMVATAALGGCKNADDDGAGGGATTSATTSDGGAGGSDGAGGNGTSSTTTGGRGDGGAGTGGGAPAACWDPTPASGEDTFVAVDGANTHTFELTLPDDPEGGLVTVTLRGRQIFSHVAVRDADGEGFTILDFVAEGDDVAEGSSSFAGAPGVTYEVHVEESWVTATDREATVGLSWSLAPTRDCFEPNDTPGDATPLATGQEIEAYLFAGYTTNDWPSYEDHHDHYLIEVDEAATLTATLEPGLDAVALILAPADAPDQPITDGFTIDEAPIALSAEVDPGSYVLRVEPFVSPIYNSFDGELTAWENPYTLRATVE